MNRFHLGAVSGLITGTSAGNPVFAWRNAHASKFQFVSRLLVRWSTTTAFGTPQEMRLDVLPVTAFASANYTGGTDLSNYTGGSAVLATNAIKPRSKNRNDQRVVLRSCLDTGNVRIATTGTLSHAGSPTIATHPWMSAGATVLAAPSFESEWVAPQFEVGAGMVDFEGCMPLPPENGFVIVTPIAMGATGVGRMTVEVDWLES